MHQVGFHYTDNTFLFFSLFHVVYGTLQKTQKTSHNLPFCPANFRVDRCVKAMWGIYTRIYFLNISNPDRLEAFAAVQLMPSLFWYVTWRRLVHGYRSFGTFYQSHLQRSSHPSLTNHQLRLPNIPEENATFFVPCIVIQWRNVNQQRMCSIRLSTW